MSKRMSGLWGYTIQGFMHAKSIDEDTKKSDPKDSKKKVFNYIPVQDPAEPLQVNLAEATLQPNGAQDAAKPRLAYERPILTGYYSFDYPVPPTPPIAPTVPFPNADPAYAPRVGYYPFSESGYLILGDDYSDQQDGKKKPPVDAALYGSVKGGRRINVAGYPGSGSMFTGRYKFDDWPAPFSYTTGIITTQIDGRANMVWDYSFVQVSDSEILLATNARVARPAVGTGVMRRLREADGIG